MWKKIRSREPAISGPALVETTVDTTNMQPALGNGAWDNRNPPKLSPLPFKSVESNTQRQPPISRPPVTSSIYSQQPHQDSQRPGHLDTSNRQSEYRDSQYTDISPPDSPVGLPTRNPGDSPDVSPIDSSSEQPISFPSRENRAPASSIPIPRKTSDPPGPQRQNTPSRETRWDDYSGEPTTSDKGKPAQVRPGSQVMPEDTSSKLSKHTFNILSKGKDLGQARKKLVRNRDTKDDPAQLPPPREPWKGASGRTPIVAPIQPKKPGAPLQPIDIPSNKDNQPGPSRQPLAPRAPPSGSPAVTVYKSSNADKAPEEPTIKPVVPPKAENNSPVTQQSASSRKQSVDHSSSGTVTPRTVVRQNSNVENRKPVPLASDKAPVESEFRSRFQNIDLNQQPSSRFSMSTVATTEAGSSPSDTPRAASFDKDIPVPQIPDIKGLRHGSTKRKPTPSETSTSTSKTLPRSPPEMQATNRIDSMQARLDDLGRRKANIDTIIYELTQVIQPSSPEYDLATKSEVKRTVDSLNNELADIKKEEHEIGMKLLRAWKKRDDAEYYSQPSGLWIKRVTS